MLTANFIKIRKIITPIYFLRNKLIFFSGLVSYFFEIRVMIFIPLSYRRPFHATHSFFADVVLAAYRHLLMLLLNLDASNAYSFLSNNNIIVINIKFKFIMLNNDKKTCECYLKSIRLDIITFCLVK